MRSRVTAIVLAALTFSASLGAVVLYLLSWPVQLPDFYGFRGDGALIGVINGGVGLAIAWRQPRNVVGWIFLVSGVSLAIAELGSAYAIYALLVQNGAVVGGVWVAWLGGSFWAPGTLAPAVLLLFFPDGRLLSRRWRTVAAYTVTVIALQTLFGVGLPGPLRAAPFATNPLGPFPGRDLLERLDGWRSASFNVPVNLPFVLGVVALVVRFRRSRGVARLQMKWITYALVLLVCMAVIQPAGSQYKPFQVAFVLVAGFVPIAIGIAILRYRLYDIDLLINRTLVYGATTAGIGAAFFAGIILLESALRPFTTGNELAVAVSTIISFALFQPLSAGLQRAVDRRFYRSRYDAARTVDRFTSRLADEVDLDAVRADLLEAVTDTMQPAHASVWLRSRGMRP